jgi:hypothetical protein
VIKLGSVQFGTDAEMFLRTLTGNPIPVCGMLGGTKDNPKPMEGLPNGFFIQEDNAAAEFNIPPSQSITRFIDNTQSALSWVRNTLPKSVYLDEEHSSVVFDKSYLEIPEINRFGCEADYNAFTISTNRPPRPHVPGFRSAAAHVHIGWDKPEDDDRLELIRLADVFVTCAQVPRETPQDHERRTLYGKAGAFRPKNYGVEHRVLSNSWIGASGTMRTVLQRYLMAIAALNVKVTVAPGDYNAIQEAINSGDKDKCAAINQSYTLEVNKAVGKKWDWQQYFLGFK